MRGFLLDTNVISELTRDRPDPGVVAFLSEHDEIWLSAVVLHELEFGLRLLPPGRRRDGVGTAVSAFVAEYEDRVLPLGRTEASHAAALRAWARRSGRTLDLADALIVGTAVVHELAVVTRNVRDFDGLGVEVLDPWGPA